LAFTKNEQVEIAATVVVVGVKLLRPPRVEQGQGLWVGVTQRPTMTFTTQIFQVVVT